MTLEGEKWVFSFEAKINVESSGGSIFAISVFDGSLSALNLLAEGIGV